MLSAQTRQFLDPVRMRDGHQLSESHSFQANACDDGGNREMAGKPGNSVEPIQIFKLKILLKYLIFLSEFFYTNRH